MFVLSYNAGHYFQLKKLFIFSMLENSAPPSWKFSPLVINSSMERYSHVTPSPDMPRPQREKVPLKTSVHFIITIILCNAITITMVKVCDLQPTPLGLWRIKSPRKKLLLSFRLRWTEWLSQNFDPVTFEKKCEWKGAKVPSHLFGHLKTGTRTSNFR